MAHSLPRPRHLARRAAAVVGIAGALSLMWAGVASAHVEIDPGTVAPGEGAVVSFKVPNERDDADTNKVEVQLPTDHPLASVSVEPIAGWTIETTTEKLPKPVTTDDGEVTEAVSTITWSGGKIAPGQFQRFAISIGPIPDDVDSLQFKALQTYSDGDVVRWIDETPASGEEPEHPAPTLTISADADGGDTHADSGETSTTVAASSGDHSESASSSSSGPSTDDVDSAKTMGTVGIVVGALGLLVAIGALLRRPKSGTAS